MKRKWWIIPLVPPAVALFFWLFGEVVMHLWNWLLPMLFGWKTITFWQAWGLIVLCRILFGGFGNGGGRGPKFRKRAHERWEALTPEERERFRERMGARCGGFGAPPTESKGTA